MRWSSAASRETVTGIALHRRARGGGGGLEHARQDSNLRPLPPEGSALSTELRAQRRRRTSATAEVNPWSWRSSPTPTCPAALGGCHLIRPLAAPCTVDHPRRRHQHGGGARRAPNLGEVAAVHGNVDDAELTALLPTALTLTVAGTEITVIHDAGPRPHRLERLRARFPQFGSGHLRPFTPAPARARRRRVSDLQSRQPDRAPPRPASHDGAGTGRERADRLPTRRARLTDSVAPWT